MLSVEKTDSYVRFHAWQSVLAFAAAAAVSMLLPTVPVVGDWRFIRVVFTLSVLALYVFLIVKALQGGPDDRRVQTGNNRGGINGWTKAVYGRATVIRNP